MNAVSDISISNINVRVNIPMHRSLGEVSIIKLVCAQISSMRIRIRMRGWAINEVDNK